VPFDDIVDALRSLDDPNPPRPGGARSRICSDQGRSWAARP
jgi:hypothetical protein